MTATKIPYKSNRVSGCDDGLYDTHHTYVCPEATITYMDRPDAGGLLLVDGKRWDKSQPTPSGQAGDVVTRILSGEDPRSIGMRMVWTLDVTRARRASWHARMRGLLASGAQIDLAREEAQAGHSLNDLRWAVRVHGLDAQPA